MENQKTKNKDLIVLLLCLVAMIFVFKVAKADKIVYLGNDRYTCVGDKCDSFNAKQQQTNREKEIEEQKLELQRREYDETIEYLRTQVEKKRYD